MILGIGTDLVSVDRIEKMLMRFGRRFEERLFTSREQAYCRAHKHPAYVYAKRFSAKEAASKALGLGFRQGVRFVDLEVVNNSMRKPELRFHGRALEHLKKRIPQGFRDIGCIRVDLSLSDEGSLAMAFVIISYDVIDSRT